MKKLSATAAVSLVIAASFVLPVSAQGGRAGNWKYAAQDAPQLPVAKRQAEKNPADPLAQNDYGWSLRQHGDLAGAEKALREAIRLKPEMSQAHSNLSVVLLDKAKVPEALEEAKRAVALDPKQPIYRVVLGNALVQGGDRKTAIDEYRLAVTFRPDYQNAHYHLGRTLADDGQLLEAKKELSAALQLDPNDGRTLQLLDKLINGEMTKSGKPN